MAPDDRSRNLRIGLLVTASLTVLAVFIFFIGSEQKLFAKKNRYEVLFEHAQGLAEGNPVHMSGVSVGVVQNIRLPRMAENRLVEIEISVDKRYAHRIRQDSRARLKKLGLIAADTYVDITPGSADKDMLEPGSLIPSARQTNVDQLIGQGEDLVDNFVQMSVSLRNILERVDRGEGLLGELTMEPETKERVTDTFIATLNKVNHLVDEIEGGGGLVGKLLVDEAYGKEFTESLGASLASIRTIATTIETAFNEGEGAIPVLLNDPVQRDRIVNLVANLDETSANLAELSRGLTGQGLVPRLVNDEVYAEETLREFHELATRLNVVAGQLAKGEGAAGRLISDPAVYESINDILIGINESAMLRWLVRRSQKKGIEKRFNAVNEHGEPDPGQVVTPTPIPVNEVEPLVPVPPVVEDPPPPAVDPTPPTAPTGQPDPVEADESESGASPLEPEPVESEPLPEQTGPSSPPTPS